MDGGAEQGVEISRFARNDREGLAPRALFCRPEHSLSPRGASRGVLSFHAKRRFFAPLRMTKRREMTKRRGLIFAGKILLNVTFQNSNDISEFRLEI